MTDEGVIDDARTLCFVHAGAQSWGVRLLPMKRLSFLAAG